MDNLNEIDSRKDIRTGYHFGHGVSPSEVVTGSCATDAREPGQDRKVAAFIGIVSVPQIAWSSPQSARFHQQVALWFWRFLLDYLMRILLG